MDESCRLTRSKLLSISPTTCTHRPRNNKKKKRQIPSFSEIPLETKPTSLQISQTLRPIQRDPEKDSERTHRAAPARRHGRAGSEGRRSEGCPRAREFDETEGPIRKTTKLGKERVVFDSRPVLRLRFRLPKAYSVSPSPRC